MSLFGKISPYLIVIFAAVLVTHLIDRQTMGDPETIDLEQELKPYIETINQQQIQIDSYETHIQHENAIQNGFKVRHDSVIPFVRESNYKQFDSLSTNLINRIRSRQNTHNR